MLGMLSEFICCAILDAVGLELVSYVFDGNPKSLNADPDNVSSSSLVSIIGIGEMSVPLPVNTCC